MILVRFSLVLVACCIALVACAQAGSDPSPSDSGRPVRSAPELPTIPPSGDPIIGEVPAEILSNLLADAAERAGVDIDDVEVVQAEATTWSDGSLGCPEPGMFYTQALVDGYHVILDAGGEEFDFRVTSNGGFVLCERDRPAG